MLDRFYPEIHLQNLFHKTSISNMCDQRYVLFRKRHLLSQFLFRIAEIVVTKLLFLLQAGLDRYILFPMNEIRVLDHRWNVIKL